MLNKMFQYRIYPTKKQERLLNQALEECRWLYNHLLEKRKAAYEQEGRSLSCFEQQRTYGILKQERPSLHTVHSQVLQNVAVRIDLAFKAFFRRMREGAEDGGYPRFKGKHRKAVARVHERIVWRRQNFTHQHSRSIVDRFGMIAVEDLTVNHMMHNHCLAKSIADASWSAFFDQLTSKAAEAGRQLTKVNPAYTSQTCSRCGHRQPMPLDVRVFDCLCCHVQLDRDLNAALNICALGRQGLGLVPRSPRL